MLFVVTCSDLCKDNFLTRIEKIAISHPDRIILREKQMTENVYRTFAYHCYSLCKLYNVNFSVNGFVNIAREIRSDLHISFPVLKKYPTLAQEFRTLGVSVHSVEEAREAEKMGVSYIVAGHIFKTDCKIGVPPRGLDFLRDVSDSVNVPVLAIGGITKDKLPSVYENSASGVCVMSHFMECDIDVIQSEIFSFKNV